MKKIINKNNIIVILVFIVGIVMIFIGFNYNSKDSKLSNVREAIENIFFYLPDDNYSDMSSISDYCKINLVYNTKYLKNYTLLNSNDYSTDVKNSKNVIKSYKMDEVLKGLKSILGKDVTLDYSVDEVGNYKFLMTDSCLNSNKSIGKLSYNEMDKLLFSINNYNSKNVDKLYVKWDKPIYGKDGTIILNAKALLAIKNNNGGYDLFADYKLSYLAGSVEGFNIESKIDSLYSKSFDYKITLKKVDGNYIWTGYERINNVYGGEDIQD